MVGTLKISSRCEVSNSGKSSNSVKFVCSYGGKILPRHPDGKLRYSGGETRLLSLDRPSISYSELMMKLCEVYGYTSVSLRCQLPNEDLDTLVSIKSEEDLINLMEVYDLAEKKSSSPLKIKAFLFPSKSMFNSPPVSVSSSSSVAAKKCSQPSSTTISSPVISNKSIINPHYQHLLHNNQISSSSLLMSFPNFHPHVYNYYPRCIPPYQGSPRQVYLVHNGNHWQY